MTHFLRILLAVHHFPPNYLSGAEWQAYRIARWLKDTGHEVRVICVESDTQGPSEECEHRDEVYHGIPVRRLYFNLPASPDPLWWSFRNPAIERHLMAYLADYRPDLLHLISGYLMTGVAISAAQALGITTILMPMDFWFLCPRITLLRVNAETCEIPEDPLDCLLCLAQDKRRYRLTSQATRGLSDHILRHLWRNPAILRMMNRKDHLDALHERRTYLRHVFESADGVISNSHFLAGMLESQGLHAKRLFYLRQGLDIDGDFHTETQEQRRTGAADVGRASQPVRDGPGGHPQHKVPSPYLRIGYTGQIARHKGVDLLIQAFQRIQTRGPTPKLRIYGDPKRFPRFARYVQGLAASNDHVEFAGTFKNDQFMQVHSRLDVLAVPSVGYENSPNVILEAFAAGTPVVASNAGGIAELVQHEVNGLLFKTGDVTDLARQLQRLVDQPGMIESLRQGIPPVKTVQEEMAELLEIYHAVLEGS